MSKKLKATKTGLRKTKEVDETKDVRPPEAKGQLSPKQAADAKAAEAGMTLKGTPKAPKNPKRGSSDEVKSAERAGLNLQAIIKVLSPANPKHPTSASFRRFALYQNKDGSWGGETVAHYLHKGVRTADVRWDMMARHAFIELVETGAKTAAKPVKEAPETAKAVENHEAAQAAA